MLLARLLDGVQVRKLFSLHYGAMAPTQDVEIHNVQYDSRRVERGDLFVALPGTATDGARFIEDAIERGAVAVMMQDDAARPDAYFQHTGVMKIVVPNARQALARVAANFRGRPSEKLRLIGVTGTNGKTTTAYLIKAALEAAGERVGLIGTISYDTGTQIVPATHTTPESVDLQSLLATMVDNTCTAAVMEVSSHALAMHRVYGLRFAAAVFTNFTQDHLDYHGSMEEYLKAKKMLFDMLSGDAVAVVNADDPAHEAVCAGSKARRVTFGTGDADVVARDIQMNVQGMVCTVVRKGVSTPLRSALTGRFNVLNLLGAFAVTSELGVEPSLAAQGLATLKAVRGRFEQILAPSGWTAVIDYAHTPDALQNTLLALRELLPRTNGARVITVFGCGGNRDRDKRPKMGRIASEFSDIVVITSDNPRQEEPQAIIDQVAAGVLPGKTVYTEIDRRQAIIKGLLLAEAGDVVLIAGKGHEDYQVVGSTKSHLDDREEVEMFIRNMK
jgi:UDP-N-acetylmuramoyl-L-alanyl-D-glutamate--2,6-diaminopimelate ligase